jgi:hypothetical protein
MKTVKEMIKTVLLAEIKVNSRLKDMQVSIEQFPPKDYIDMIYNEIEKKLE